jgi:hypothetical protein
MKVIKDCWDEIGASESTYGAHVFQNSTAKIYVVEGLDVGSEMSQLFSHRTEGGFAGHCHLVFRGVKKFDFVVHPYAKENEKTVWGEPVFFHYETEEAVRSGSLNLNKYILSGDLQGFMAYVAIEIEAEAFEINILDEAECK